MNAEQARFHAVCMTSLSVPPNWGELVAILHRLGYELPEPPADETDRLAAVMDRELIASLDRPPVNFGFLLDAAKRMGYRRIAF